MAENANILKLIQRSDFLFGQKAVWNTLWEEVAEYIIPRKSGIFGGKVPGAKQTKKLYDSTGIHSAERLANILNGYLTPVTQRWFTVLPDEEETEEDLLRAFEKASRQQYAMLKKSNFYAQIGEVYLDLVTIGTSALYYQKSLNGLDFLALPIEEYAIAETRQGDVKTLFRRFSMTAESAIEEWGEGRVGESISKIYEKNPYEQVPIIHAVYPRTKRDKDKRDSVNMPFASAYISATDKTIIQERGFLRFPFFVARWSKSSGEVYGRSPAMTALPDVRTTNKARENTLKAGGKLINPPMVIQSDAFLKKPDITEGALNDIEAGRNPDSVLRVLQLGAPMDSAIVFMNDLRKTIKEMFFADQVETLMAMGGPAKTATEVQIQYELLQQMLGPTLGRIETELLSPLIKGVFLALYENGQFPELQEYYGDIIPEVKIRYEGVLAKAQRSSELLSIQRIEDSAAASGQLYPEVVDNLDFDAILRYKAQLLGVPITLFRSQEDVAELREARRQEQAEAKQAQEALTASQGIKNVSGLLTKGGNGRGI